VDKATTQRLVLTRDAFLSLVIIQVLLIIPKTHVNVKEQNILTFDITLRDNVEKGLISMDFCATNNQIADIFTKALSREQFERNRLEMGLIKTT